jgi:hypothetical protein
MYEILNVPIPEVKVNVLSFDEFYESMQNQKYRKHYEKLVTRSQNRIVEGYTEKHHIIPKCLCGTNDKANLVRLTPSEHYVAHQFLLKCFKGNRKLVHAAKMMTTNKWGRRSNKLYGWLRNELSVVMKKRIVSDETRAKNRAYGNSAEAKANFAKIHAAQIGTPFSEERLLKMSIASKKRGISAETRDKMIISRKAGDYVMSEEQKDILRLAHLGTKHSKETLLKMSISQKARPPRSAETCAKISENNRNRPSPSAETRAKTSASLIGTKQSPETIAKRIATLTGKKRGSYKEGSIENMLEGKRKAKVLREILAAWSCAL